jgi:hypothetical protein
MQTRKEPLSMCVVGGAAQLYVKRHQALEYEIVDMNRNQG